MLLFTFHFCDFILVNYLLFFLINEIRRLAKEKCREKSWKRTGKGGKGKGKVGNIKRMVRKGRRKSGKCTEEERWEGKGKRDR
jgi:hypothetical protein